MKKNIHEVTGKRNHTGIAYEQIKRGNQVSQNNKKTVASAKFSVITTDVNDLDPLIKRHRLVD